MPGRAPSTLKEKNKENENICCKGKSCCFAESPLPRAGFGRQFASVIKQTGNSGSGFSAQALPFRGTRACSSTADTQPGSRTVPLISCMACLNSAAGKQGLSPPAGTVLSQMLYSGYPRERAWGSYGQSTAWCRRDHQWQSKAIPFLSSHCLCHLCVTARSSFSCPAYV